MYQRRAGALLAAAASVVALGVAVPANAAPGVREDCRSGHACGWQDAYFSNSYYDSATAIGNYYMPTGFNNSFSSIRNVHSGTTATYFDYTGSTARVCLPYNYENGNLAGTNMQDKTSYIQVSGFAC